MDFLSGLLSAGSSLLGGMFTSRAQQAQADLQNEAMHHGISIKAHDARDAEAKYGINPLVSMGASASMPSPVAVGGLGDGISGMGAGLASAAKSFDGDATRATKLNNELMEAKIANVKSDTVRNAAAASQMVTAVPKAPSPNIPDLYTDFKAPDGSLVRLPSSKASSSLQNMAAWPSNLAIGSQMLSHNLGLDDAASWVKKYGSLPLRGDVWRGVGNAIRYPDMPY